LSIRGRIAQAFDVYSRRRRGGKYPPDVVSRELRVRTFLYIQELFGGRLHAYRAAGDYFEMFVEEIYPELQRLYGRLSLARLAHLEPRADFCAFLETGTASEFLDVLELMFRVPCLWRVVTQEPANRRVGPWRPRRRRSRSWTRSSATSSSRASSSSRWC
jgi:hypothetical protein